MKKQKNQVQELREEFLSPQEIFLVEYMESFNRESQRKWQSKNLAIFSTA